MIYELKIAHAGNGASGCHMSRTDIYHNLLRVNNATWFAQSPMKCQLRFLLEN